MTAVLAGGVLVGLLLLAEMVSRAMASVVDEDVWLRDAVMQRKDDQMRWHARRRPPDVVFLGSSSIMCAVDPTQLERDFGIRSYNAGISRGTMSYVAAWARDFVFARLSPSVVVIECWVATLNDASWLVEDWMSYSNAPIFTSRARWRWYYELGHRFVLLRVITKFSSIGYLIQASRQMVKKAVFLRMRRPLLRGDLIGLTGEATEYDGRETNFTGPKMEQVLRGVLANYSVGGSEWEALHALATEQIGRGARVFLLRTPTTDEHKAFFDGGAAGWKEAEERVSKLAATIDIPCLIPEANLVAATDFADATHANGNGKAKFTEALGNALRAHGIGDGGAVGSSRFDGNEAHMARVSGACRGRRLPLLRRKFGARLQ